MQINNQLINRWVRNLEVGVTVIWLLYFLGVNLPSPLPTLMKALSYPVIAILVILCSKRLPYVATRDKPLLLFIGTAVASLLWTADQGTTLDGIRGVFRTLMFGAYIATRYSVKEQMKIWAWVFGIAAILSLAVALVKPSYGIDKDGWIGIFAYKNHFGYTMTIGTILFLIFALKDRRQNWWAWIGCSIAVPLIVLARSTASIICILVLLSVMPIYQLVKQHYKLRVILLGTACLLGGGVVILILGNLETILVDILGKGLEMDGRGPIWDLVVEKAGERPWLGYGFNAFWKSDAGVYVMLHTWSGFREEGFNTHNGYLDMFLSLGFLGMLLYLMSLVTAFIRVVTLLLSTKKIEFFWLLQFLIYTCVSSLADSYDLLIVYISISLSIAVEWEGMNTKRQMKKLTVT